ncbi:hypothetical protein [Actinoplanes rectilineatus]|uniref:hypothetical protein n=1 Tax=Actinoplanes rectilineatus TaxID=113571 RepID=UPI0005F2C6DA|nr:hypothetical protein [Actinoplanes rectilineatus]
MTSTSAKPRGAWLTNYYLRGVITLVVAFIAIAAGAQILAFWAAVATWFGLWLAARAWEGYAGTDDQP